MIESLKSSESLVQKKAIGDIWKYFPKACQISGEDVLLGDDAAAIKFDDHYLLLAGEGVFQPLIESNPYLAGRTSVLANVNDIYSMGGRPVAIVDVLFSSDSKSTEEILRGISDNAARYKVPVVGGHISQDTQCSSLSVFILGKAKNLLSSFNAKDGDDLVFISNSKGKFVSGFNFWDSSSMLGDEEVLDDLELIAEIAEEGLADTAKDVSMAGLIGSILMLLESSQRGALLNLDKIPKPCEVPLKEWLLAFPSFGFIMSLRPENTDKVKDKFQKRGLKCEKIGQVTSDMKVSFVNKAGEKELFWNLRTTPFIGVGDPIPN
ncbi:MAG: sll0787 family AIR synthase-like protein [Candidatus Dadabacteria bacterium]|nr:sll0787 family AIR synthase-like protein [Candidatus Dadabacteria bacterium]